MFFQQTMNLSDFFQEIYHKCSNGEYCCLKNEELLELTGKIEECQKMVYSESIFSKNEELDDVSTESLKVKSILLFSLFSVFFNLSLLL
jgi:5'-3' exonuclease